MSLIKLSNVSKFYYSKGVIASGFSKVNLSFDMGEFVVITGESGSGKSTLLNVISGLDSYEEGEMYINGEETSHYTEENFEEYRRKYVGNIFQSFNLVNSYTVYQNIELVLLLNGNKKKDIKNRVIELIKEVGLYKFRNTKVSKLSGGQKQRVAIARALAKNTPMIIADEPTGNLDSKSAKEVLKLLSEIAKDKLVIVVTHNYDQVSEYATRKIKMHDGKVIEDQVLKHVDKIDDSQDKSYKDITFLNKIRLSLRNCFNIIPKFLLLLTVYLFITISLISEYASFKKQEYIESINGYNYIFSNTDDKRIIIKKNDKTAFTDEEYERIKSLNNVKTVVKNDVLLDTNVSFTDEENFWLGVFANELSNFEGELTIGRMPTNDNEIILVGSENDYYIGYVGEELLTKDIYIQNYFDGTVDKENKIRVTGIKYSDNESDYNIYAYVSNKIIDKFNYQVNQSNSISKILFLNRYRDSNPWDVSYKIIPNKNVPKGSVYVSDDLSYECPKGRCKGQALTINVKSIYYEDNLNLIVSNTYTKRNIKYLLGVNYDDNNGAIFISTEDYDSLYNKDYYQSSVFVEDVNNIDEVVNNLNDMGLTTLKIKDTLVNDNISKILGVIRTTVTIILVIALILISYFVIRIILKSRNKYYSTIRMLGATKKVSRKLLIYELFVVSNIAFILFLIMMYLYTLGLIKFDFIKTVLTYLSLKDYIILYLLLVFMSYIISSKFAKTLFKKSAMSTFVEEV